MNPTLANVTLTFLQLSLLAVGGANSVMPEIRRAVVVHSHWMNDETFSRLFAIAQAAPGPNVLLVSLIGWRLVGLSGMLAATLAMLAPSTALAFVVGRAWRRWETAPIIATLRYVLAPVAIGLLVASGTIMAKASDRSVATAAITASVVAMVVFTRRSPIWGLVAAAVLAIALRRLGVAL